MLIRAYTRLVCHPEDIKLSDSVTKELTFSVLNYPKSVNAKYRLALFDFDGTLCHTEAVDIHTIRKVYQTLHQPAPSLEAIQEALGKGLVTKFIFQYLSPEADTSLIQAMLLSYKAIYPTQTGLAELFPGVIPLLGQLKEADIVSVIVSNKAIEMLKSAVESLRIGRYFHMVIGVQADGMCKPDPKLYTRFIAPHLPAIQPHEILMVGDTSTDLSFATAISVDSCWASYGSGDPGSCQALQPKYTIQRVSDLLGIILPTD